MMIDSGGHNYFVLTYLSTLLRKKKNHCLLMIDRRQTKEKIQLLRKFTKKQIP